MPFTPHSFATWKHGWIPVELKYFEQFGIDFDGKCLVATKEQECFLKKLGKNSRAVGVPYIYIKYFDGFKVKRQINLLLVMPPHGLPNTTKNWDEESYVKEIYNLKNDFDLIVACISPSCVGKKSWIESFEKYEIPWIKGADIYDKNALIRMHRIFQSFEYMTTNATGSHIAYAAYSGCKVSIYGQFYEFSSKYLKEDLLYKYYPHVLDYTFYGQTKKIMSKKYPFLFIHPKEACERMDWGAKELGENNRVSIFQLAYHLVWLPHQ